MSLLRLMILALSIPLPGAASPPDSTVMPYAPELFPDGVSGSVSGFSPDGDTIYFARENAADQRTYLYQASREGDRWDGVVLLPFSGNHNDLGGRLTADGNAFYFTSDRPGGSSSPDDTWNIWVSERIQGAWQPPRPIRAINDPGNECCPTPLAGPEILFSGDRGNGRSWWIHRWNGDTESTEGALTEPGAWQWPSYYSPEHKLLFFNSMKRPDGLGGDDIYVARLLEDGWSEVVNIGPPVNTERYEDGAILAPDGATLIFNRHVPGSEPSRVFQVALEDLALEFRQAE